EDQQIPAVGAEREGREGEGAAGEVPRSRARARDLAGRGLGGQLQGPRREAGGDARQRDHGARNPSEPGSIHWQPLPEKDDERMGSISPARGLIPGGPYGTYPSTSTPTRTVPLPFTKGRSAMPPFPRETVKLALRLAPRLKRRMPVDGLVTLPG